MFFPRPEALRESIMNYFFEDPSFALRRFSLHFLPFYRTRKDADICILDTSNDLILCCENRDRQSVYHICNPLTMQWVALPPVRELGFGQVAVSFICEPFYREDGVGGVAVNSDYRFRVVRAVKDPKSLGHGLSYDSRGQLLLEIFSSDTGEWINTLLPCYALFHLSPLSLKAVACNRMLLCARYVGMCKAFNPFDVDADQCGSVGVHFESRQKMLPWVEPVLCGDRLLFPTMYGSRDRPRLAVLELVGCNRGGGSWRLWRQLQFAEMVPENKYLVGELIRATLLGFHPNDENILYLLYPNGHTAVCDMHRRTLNWVTAVQSSDVSPHWDSRPIFRLVLPWWPTPVPKLSQG